ncbi:MAG TPA: P-loop NTPase [Acidimicrobiales bacterium]|nr:P-loop NTPase [Acidimicrobiales bacterium]
MTESRLRVAVVGVEPTLESRLTRLLGDRAAVASHASLRNLELGSANGPTVVVLGPSFSAPDVLEGAARHVAAQPNAGALLVVDELSTQVLQRALRAGMLDVVNGTDVSELERAVHRVAEHLSQRTPAAVSPVAAGDARAARLVTVFSPKGGAGKSVVACNLAVALAQRSSEAPVALIDADLQFGDVAVMLKLTPLHTIVDAVTAMHRLDVPLLRSLLCTHQSGLLVLAAPREPAFGDQVQANDMHRIVELLRSFCSYVIIDTPAQFSDVALHLIEESDDLVLVAGMDVPSIKNMKIGLQTLKLLGTPSNKLRLVLNRANARVGLDVSEVEKTLHLKAEALLPSDILVPQSVNKGVPAVVGSPKSAFAKTMSAFADLIAPDLPRRRG